MLKEYFKNKTAILFDLDGTLIDTEPLWDEAMHRILLKINHSYLEVDIMRGFNMYDRWTHTVSKNKDTKLPMTIRQLTDATNNEFLQLFRQQPEKELTEGFWSFIAELKDREIKTALVTNTEKSVSDQMLSLLDISDVFDLVVTADDVKKHKPDPEPYKHALKLLNVKNKNALAIEDTVIGSESAIKAGIETVVIREEPQYRPWHSHKVKVFAEDFQYLLKNMDIGFWDEMERLRQAPDPETENQSPAI